MKEPEEFEIKSRLWGVEVAPLKDGKPCPWHERCRITVLTDSAEEAIEAATAKFPGSKVWGVHHVAIVNVINIT